MNHRHLDVRILLADDDVQEFPLKVATDWDSQAREATAACRLIDRHLDHEARTRNMRSPKEFPPQGLCPEQRVQLITDLLAVSRS